MKVVNTRLQLVFFQKTSKEHFMSKPKSFTSKSTARTPEEELPFWESHAIKVAGIYDENPNEKNQEWKNNVEMRVQKLRQQIAEPKLKSVKPKF